LYVSIEKHPIAPADLKRIFSFWPELRDYAGPLLEQYPPPLEGFYHLHFPAINVRLVLCLGDVADVLPEIRGMFDAWYLDGFSPAKNPAMWEEKLFSRIAARTKSGGTLTTFSSAGAVRRGLEAAGFAVEKVQGFGVKRDMTVAKMPAPVVPSIRPARKITVLGAGLAGASAAYACAQKGFDVTVIDRQPAAAQETSGNPVGILYPKLTADMSPLGIFFQHGFFFTRNLVTTLELKSWHPCGIAEIKTTEDAAEWQHALAAKGFWPEEFMTYNKQAGLHFPFGGYLSPPELCRRLLDHPRIKTIFSQRISSLDSLPGDTVIIAGGYDTKNFKETSWLPLVSVRGQMTYLRENAQSRHMSMVICHEGSISPAVNGLHHAGATFQREPPAEPALRAEDHAENLDNLAKYLPHLGFTTEDIIGGRVGYRASLPDHLPALGPCPDHDYFVKNFSTRGFAGKYSEKIYLSTGFGGQGLSGTPLAGEIIACLIAGDPLPLPQSVMPYLAPERFILRDLKRGKIS
jgi:tRNA 5-methylaminomethyl-2-thiouridine biosynthesis bifunctional protein